MIPFRRQFETTTLETEGKQTKVWSVAFDPLGKYLLAGTDSKILVLNSESGELVRSINEHAAKIYCVAFCPDGMSFASGGSDKNVMLWKRNCDGILRYSHSYPIQHIEYNPISFDLLSTTSNDLCIWSLKRNKRIHKNNISSKCLSTNWSPNGKLFALSLQNNSVLIYNKFGKQIYEIKSNKHHNIVCCKWYDNNTLIICSWQKLLSFYDIQFDDANNRNQKNLKIKVRNIQNTKLAFYPNSICLIKNACLIISGLDSNLYLYTIQGKFVEKYQDIKNNQEKDWILSICNHSTNRVFFYGTNNGNLICNKMIFKTVHSLFKNRYCYRDDNLCDLYIENIETKKKFLLQTNGYIKMIAIYKHRLAVLFTDKIAIYSSNQYDLNESEFHYKLFHKINIALDFSCNLLIITNNNLVICTQNELQLLDFSGKNINKWQFNSPIRYIKNISGAPNKEGILVGLANGEIYTVFIDKKYPILHYKHAGTIRCVDISSSKTKLSIVGTDRKISIYDLNEKKILFQDTNANSVAFNDEFDDMFAFTSSNGIATIRNFNGNFEFSAKTDGFIVRFCASTVYTLFASKNIMASFNIPQSQPLKKYIQSKSFANAYKIACLGVTEFEWKNLGLKAIESMRFDIARKAFTNLKCIKEIIKYTEFVNFLQMKYENNKKDQHKHNLLLADILAFQGQFDKAAKIYCNNNKYERGIEMYLDLRDWRSAKELIQRYSNNNNNNDKLLYSMNDLLLKQAKWLQSQGDKISAAEMYWAAKQYKSGFDILFETKQYDIIKPKILSLLSQNMQQKNEQLTVFYEYIAGKFKKLNDISFVKEIYIATKNYSKLIEIYIEREEWDEAFIIIKEHKEMKKDILLPYARWLALNDKFDQASKAFHEAGFPENAIKILNNLTRNCLIQKKYNDTAYYYWLLAIEHLKFGHMDKFQLFKHKSLLYYAYNIINQYIESPFTSYTAETLFHSARFALSCCDGEDGHGVDSQISTVSLLYILCKQCIILGAYKFGRSIICKLITLRMPPEWREKIELDSLIIRTRPFSDPPHLSSYVCARCSTTNYNNNNTQNCRHCSHTFIRCMISFQTLPLVEFKIVDSLSHDEAIQLIQREPARKHNKALINESFDGEQNDENQDVNVMTLDDMNEDAEEDDNDVFYQQLMDFDSADHDGGNIDDEFKKSCIILDGIALEKINPCEIFVIDYRKYFKDMIPKYYRCIVPEECYDIIKCLNCQFLFLGEEYEVALINNGHLCPFCRYKFS